MIISQKRSEYFFSFDDEFKIHDDIEILKRMGLLLGKNRLVLYCWALEANGNVGFVCMTGLDKGECSYDDIQRAKSMVPKSFQRYIECEYTMRKHCTRIVSF